MITSMRGCVAYNDLWPWPISPRSFGLDLENRVLSVASTVLDGFFPYLVQMITSMRRCVACDDLWPWPISSRSFGLDLENCVHSVASTVLDGFFLYLAQMITIIRRCVACCVFFRIWKFKILANILNFSALTLKKKSTILNGFFPYLAQMITSMRGCVAYNDLWPWPISSRSFGLDLENHVLSVASTVLDGFFPYLVQMISSMRRCRIWWPLTLTYIFKVIRPWPWKLCPLYSIYSSWWILSIFWYKWSLAWEDVSHVMTSDLDLYLQGHSTLTLKIVSAL